MSVYKIEEILTELKTSLESLNVFKVEVHDELLEDPETQFHPDDNVANMIYMRLVPDEEGRSLILDKIPGSWSHYNAIGRAQLLCNYENMSRIKVVDSLVSILRDKHELTSVTWDTQAILEYLFNDISTTSLNLVLIEFNINTVIDIDQCDTLTINEC